LQHFSSIVVFPLGTHIVFFRQGFKPPAGYAFILLPIIIGELGGLNELVGCRNAKVPQRRI